MPSAARRERKEILMRKSLIAVVVLWSIAGLGRPVAAQGAPLGFSYSYMQFAEDDPRRLPAGWVIAIGGDAGRVFTPVVEAATNYRRELRRTQLIWTLQGGLRFSPAPAARVRPFAQLLVGAIGSGCCTETNVRPVLEPGGGLDIPLSDRVSIQVAGGVPIVLADGGGSRLFRLRAGLAVSLW
jgi:hypothetical protein